MWRGLQPVAAHEIGELRLAVRAKVNDLAVQHGVRPGTRRAAGRAPGRTCTRSPAARQADGAALQIGLRLTRQDLKP